LFMFDIFKKTADGQSDVKGIRDALLRFIKEQLQRVEGGEGRHIKALHLYLACSDADMHLYESAVYSEQESIFRNEVQRIADDFAIDLPDTWTMETVFTDALPPEAIRIPGLDAALFIQTRKHSLQKSAMAFIKVLNGEAEQEEYTIHSGQGKINIGREKKVQAEGGFFRINTIAFPGESSDESNKFISRLHAHIEWDEETCCFMIFADEGGIPPANKIKVRSERNEHPIRLNSTQIGHRLLEGDQIILGESAILLFSYLQEEEY
jgi:hypothetical protein